jgi:phage terminase large subunit-like protein
MAAAAEKVNLGQRTPGKYERLAFERHDLDLALASRPEGHPIGLWFDVEAGDRVIEFVESFCKHYEGEWAGRPIVLEEWQKKLLRILFGWMRADGTRRFRTAYIEIPRKNGKSFLCSALSLYLLMADDEPGAQVYSFATKEEQAAIVWGGAVAMCEQSPDLLQYVTIHGEKKKTGGTIFCDVMRSKFRPLGSDSRTLDGLNPHASIADELHEHKDRRVWTKLKTATGARRQPLQLEITTAGTYDPESIGWQEHKYAQDVLDGVFEDEAFFAFIAAADDGDDVFAVETQRKANPNYGVSAKPSTLAEAANLARNSPDFYNDYLRYHLNRWTQQDKRWLSVEDWLACDPVDPRLALANRALRAEALVGRSCHGGLDLSTKLDLTALVLAFPLEDGVVELLCRFWLPQATIDKEAKKGRRHYEQWVKDGWIVATPGKVIDYGFIRREVQELAEKYKIESIGYDPYNATQIATDLGESDGFLMVEFRQGYTSMSEPSKSFEAQITEAKFRHGQNPVIRWMVGNAVITKDAAGNIKPDKAKASGKIDGVVAAIMATGRLNLSGTGKTGSYIEETGSLLVL